MHAQFKILPCHDRLLIAAALVQEFDQNFILNFAAIRQAIPYSAMRCHYSAGLS
jgi:hypothetical protein